MLEKLEKGQYSAYTLVIVGKVATNENQAITGKIEAPLTQAQFEATTHETNIKSRQYLHESLIREDGRLETKITPTTPSTTATKEPETHSLAEIIQK
jgi:hypothetical protein